MSAIGLAIPFHHDVAYLRIAVESVIAQEDESWRLWVVDDSGEPGAGEEVRADRRALVQDGDRHLAEPLRELGALLQELPGAHGRREAGGRANEAPPVRSVRIFAAYGCKSRNRLTCDSAICTSGRRRWMFP